MSLSNRELALQFLELAFANRMPEAIGMLHPDLSWWVIGDPKRLRVAGEKNRVQAERLLAGFSKMLPGGMQVRVHGSTAEGERVAVELEAEGVWLDGRTYHNHYHFLIQIREGLVFRVREYMDTLHVHELSQT